MSDKVSGRHCATNLLITTTPDVCLTPIGGALVPVAYTSTAKLKRARRLSHSVRNNGQLDFQLNSRSATITGHEPGSAKGVVVPGYLEYSHVDTASASVYSEGFAVVRDRDPAWLNHPTLGPEEPRRDMETIEIPSVWEDAGNEQA